MKHTIIFLLFANSISILTAQTNNNVSISDISTHIPDVSALLDIHVHNGDKGILIPRLSSTQRTTIATPAHGLMVFDVTTNSFWFYNNTTWEEIGGADEDWAYGSGSGLTGSIHHSGNVGIGTSTPTTALEINGQATVAEVANLQGGIYFSNAFAPDNNFVGTPGNFLSFGHDNLSEDFISYLNNVFYFRDSPGGGDVSQPGIIAGAFTTYSSKQWKQNIKGLDNALATILKLRGTTYTWNEDQGGHNDFGFIAEEINQILPQIAPKNMNGEVEGVQYGKLTPYLVEAIKEQQVIIEAQNAQLVELEKRLAALETKD